MTQLPTQEGARTAAVAGILFMLVAVAAFSCGDTIGKFIVGKYAVGQLMLGRGLVALVVLSPFVWRAGWAPFRQMPRPGWQAMRVALSTVEIALFFLATVWLPLADVTACYLAAPIFITALAAIFLKEPIGLQRWTAVLVGFAGVLIALAPSATEFSGATLIALGGSLCFSVLMIVTRALRGTHEVVLTTTQMGGTVIYGVASASAGWAMPAVSDLILIALAGGISAIAMLCANRALRLAPASVVVPYQYTMILWAAAFGYAVFGDVPTLQMAAGAAIIIASGLFIFLRERASGRGQATYSPPP